MEILPCGRLDAKELYNSIIAAPYLPLDDEQVQKAFFADGCVTLGAYIDKKLVGMCSGAEKFGRGYITFVGVLPKYRGRGIGKDLLCALENQLLGEAQRIEIECHYKNPAWLPWSIGEDSHPYAPGVTDEGAAFLAGCGYTSYGVQNAYYRKIGDFILPRDILELESRLLEEGVSVELYDRERHYGIEALLDELGNEFWSEYVLKNLHKPILIASDRNGKVLSYTGPLRTQKSGRGDYCGIGALKECRGRGIGKLVFYRMCQYHKQHGADFMSLYTEDTNPAKFIYEGAGFELVYKWNNLRKVRTRA